MTSSPNIDEVEIDVEALNRKYVEERDKRKRSDAMGQYQALNGRFATFAKDPHADPNFKRDAVTEADLPGLELIPDPR